MALTDPEGMFYVEGEPRLVADTRRHILQSFEDLEFYEEDHKYLLHGKQLPSVSGIGHRFVQFPFDEERQACRYAEKHGETAAYWLRQWRQNSFRATSLGTKTHEYGESLGYLRAGHPELICPSIKKQYMPQYQYLAPIHPKEEAIVKFFDKMQPSMHLVLNEAKVYSGKNKDAARNLKEQIAGTFDMLYYYDGDGDESRAGFMVLDYKTNTKLCDDYNRTYFKMLKEPFDDYIEENLSLYTIQLSLYSLILEDIGVPIIKRCLIWLKDGDDMRGSYEAVAVPDVSDRLRMVL